MRINIYAEELPDERQVETLTKEADTGRTFFGVRIYLKSPQELHDEPGDDDRSAITFWGPRAKVAELLRQAADAMEAGKTNLPSRDPRGFCALCFSEFQRLEMSAIHQLPGSFGAEVKTSAGNTVRLDAITLVDGIPASSSGLDICVGCWREVAQRFSCAASPTNDDAERRAQELSETEQKLVNWMRVLTGDEDLGDLGDILHEHFESHGRWHWVEIYREGCRLYELMFSAAASNEYSPRGLLFSAIAAQAYEGAGAAIASMLGVDAEDLIQRSDEWACHPDEPPPPMPIDELIEFLEEHGRRATETHCKPPAAVNQAVGARIRIARERRGFTQEELAEAGRVSVSLIRDLERGDERFTLDNVEALAGHLWTTPRDLMKGIWF